MKPKIRCYYSMEDLPLGNLGDVLVPSILDSLGYSYASREEKDENVVNPGRCLLVIGSLLTGRRFQIINYPADVWGCGWKGPELAPTGKEAVRYFSVRGPLTASGLSLPPDIPLGDPALLVPHLITLSFERHGKTIVIPHLDRLRDYTSSDRCKATGCEEALSTVVWSPFTKQAIFRLTPRNAAGILYRRIRYGVSTNSIWTVVKKIAGAGFVLTGSLHGAILAQAYGVPWASYDDGHIDAPAKWADWAAYLGVNMEFARTLEEGRHWWQTHGRHGKIRSLRPLLAAFPFPILSPLGQRLAKELP